MTTISVPAYNSLGVLVPGAPVHVELRAGSGGASILPDSPVVLEWYNAHSVDTVTDGTGWVDVELVANLYYLPKNTYYRITAGVNVFDIVVPAIDGPYEAGDPTIALTPGGIYDDGYGDLRIRPGAVGTDQIGDAQVTVPKLNADVLALIAAGGSGGGISALTGDVTASGTGSVAATIAAGAVDISHLSATGTAHGGVAHLGDNTWGLPMPSPYRHATTEQTAALYYAKASGAAVKELWIGDSFAGYGASAPETTSMVAIYEQEMADLLNAAPRTVGFVPVKQMLSSGATYATSIEWDDISTTALSVRGPNYANRKIEAGEYAEVTREGTSVTIYYTAVRTGGAVVTVYINGSAVGTIDSTDATVAASPGYDAGRSQSFSRPAAGLGDCLVRVEYLSGTAFDLEGAYFHNSNSGTGVQVLRGDKPGMAFSYMNDAANPSILQFIGNNLPKVITICLGINDANTSTTSYGGTYASPSDLAAALTTMVGNIQAEYSTWMPTIRYVFQNDASVVPATWPTLYREAMMEACATLGVTFIDAHAAVGTLRSGDPLDVSNDSLHPNDYGSLVYGKLVADVARKAVRTYYPKLTMQGSIYQTLVGGAGSSAMHVRHQSGASLYLGRYAGAASVANNLLGAIGFEGELDVYGTPKVASAVRGVAEATWGASWKAGVQFMTTAATSLLVRGGFTGDGDFYTGATYATAKLSVDTSGNTVIAGTLGVTGVSTFTAQPIMSSLTASRAVFTDGSKGLVSNAITGSGNVVMSASPTLTGTIAAAAMTLSSTLVATGNVTALAGLFGDTAPSGNLIVQSTSDVTRGIIKLKDLTYVGESVTNGNEIFRRSTTASGKEASSDSYFNPRFFTAAGAGVTAMWTKALPATTAVRVEAIVFGTNSNGASPATKIWSYKLAAVYNAGGLVALTEQTTEREDSAVVNKPSFDASGGNARLKVQPPAATDNVVWHARITWQPITSPVNS